MTRLGREYSLYKPKTKSSTKKKVSLECPRHGVKKKTIKWKKAWHEYSLNKVNVYRLLRIFASKMSIIFVIWQNIRTCTRVFKSLVWISLVWISLVSYLVALRFEFRQKGIEKTQLPCIRHQLRHVGLLFRV